MHHLSETLRRHLIIALNAHPKMMRSAICRLSLEPELWLRLKPGDACAARELGVPVRQLDYALDTTARAERVASAELRRTEEAKAHIVTRFDEGYPRSLIDHPLPPPALYCRGHLPSTPAIGIVGARKCDDYGVEVADHLGFQLARAGVTVVSGFAIGIDQAAHRGAVDAGGATVGVLGCGLDLDYPRGSRGLAAEMTRCGGLITEFPFGRGPRPWHFPIRNRVIAALSSSVVVVQAKPKSGSLITAHLALELGRDVFAVPGRIFDELSQGTNGLLGDGAIPANCAADVLGHLSLGFHPGLDLQGESAKDLGRSRTTDSTEGQRQPEEALPPGLPGRILSALPPGGSGRTVEDLGTELVESVDRLLAVLLELELTGRVQRLPGPLYTR